MTETRIKISSIVENQLPQFVLEEFPLVSEFLSQYYTSLESQGNVSDILQNIDQYIKVDDSIMMEMKYPSLEQFIKNNFDFSDENATEQSFEMIADCVDKIYTEEEVWASSDVTKKEITEFLDQMNSSQFKEIEKFFETMPKLSHTVKVKNPNTKVESEVVLEGLSSFFS